MTNIKLITVTNALEHAEVLRRSAELHGWDFTCLEVEWKGFGTKLIATYNYLKEHPEVERFVFADAFDVVVFGTPEEFEKKLASSGGSDRMRLSCEKGLWPPILHPFRVKYTEEGDFNYVNSGLYYSESGLFKSALETYPPYYEIDDQYWFNMFWLLDNPGYNSLGASAILDKQQKVFNSHSFISEGEYTYDSGRVQIMGNEPIFVHSNGRTVDPQLDKLVKEMLG